MKIVTVSDTHSRHDSLTVPDGDLLIHAGDMSTQGKLSELRQFNDWLGELPHQKKLFVPGNHDFCFEGDSRKQALSRLTEATCLIDEGVTVNGLEIWGSPWQPRFFNWAFNLERGQPLREKWERIPDSTDLLVTHGPPRGIGDGVVHGEEVGCRELKKRVEAIEPKYHVFGHIHEGYGRYSQGRITYVNCSICDTWQNPRNQPIVLEL